MQRAQGGRERRLIRQALDSRNVKIAAAVGRLDGLFAEESPAEAPPVDDAAAASRLLAKQYRRVADAVRAVGSEMNGVSRVISGLDAYADAYDELAVGLDAGDEATSEASFASMEALLAKGERKLSGGLERLGL